MSEQKMVFTGDSVCDTWAESVNGLISIARKRAEQGEMEAAKRMASEISKILDRAFERLKRRWEAYDNISPTFMLFAWSK